MTVAELRENIEGVPGETEVLLWLRGEIVNPDVASVFDESIPGEKGEPTPPEDGYTELHGTFMISANEEEYNEVLKRDVPLG